jgi:hypothetical protein
MWTSFFFDVDSTSVSFGTFDCSVAVIPPVEVEKTCRDNLIEQRHSG